MGSIVLLDDLTINKIAAGEVIERPASVIKEMVENSIDAGANNIIVEIKNGGISYIRVTDNGKGIAPDDMEIAFERHATSKIRNADDLNKVTSMGFRGEALASIAAIATVEMTSKTANQTTGYKLTIEAGNVLEKEEVGCATGTTIVVRNLFFNTPVRYKFLKKDYTESGYIEDVVTRIALVHPEISIKLINSGKVSISSNGDGNLQNVIYNIYGKDIAKSVIPVDYTYEDIKITGAIGKPEIARSNRTNQLFFVNKRYVKDKIMSAATEQAYKGLITIGKFGFVILNITMDPSKVDVNVHPAKLEVRFEEENKVFQAVFHAIKNTLLKNELVRDTIKEPLPDVEKTVMQNFQNHENNLKTPGLFDYRKNDEKKIEEYTNVESKIKTNLEEKPTVNIEQKNEEKEAKNDNPLNFDEMYTKTFGTKPISEKNIINNLANTSNIENLESKPVDVKKDNISVFEQSEEFNKPNYKFIGIVFNTYIILEVDNEMYMIDQHAAHERVLYEKVKNNYYSENGKESQILLIPDIITLSHKDMELVRENIDMFKKVGFILEEFGDNTIKISGVPTILVDMNINDFFMETLDEINSASRTAKQEKEERFIATVACKAAVKAGMVLEKQEVENLMDKLFELPNPFTCPHGRPTTIKMTKYEIERKFARK